MVYSESLKGAFQTCMGHEGVGVHQQFQQQTPMVAMKTDAWLISLYMYNKVTQCPAHHPTAQRTIRPPLTLAFV